MQINQQHDHDQVLLEILHQLYMDLGNSLCLTNKSFSLFSLFFFSSFSFNVIILNRAGKPFPTSSSSGSLAPPPMQRNQTRNSNESQDNDLISFINLTEDNKYDDLTASVTSSTDGSHERFKKIVDEIHWYTYFTNLFSLIFNFTFFNILRKTKIE